MSSFQTNPNPKSRKVVGSVVLTTPNDTSEPETSARPERGINYEKAFWRTILLLLTIGAILAYVNLPGDSKDPARLIGAAASAVCVMIGIAGLAISAQRE